MEVSFSGHAGACPTNTSVDSGLLNKSEGCRKASGGARSRVPANVDTVLPGVSVNERLFEVYAQSRFDRNIPITRIGLLSDSSFLIECRGE